MAALRIDILRESAHRIVIRIHMAEGNIAEARRAYDRCYQLLVQDLGLEPTAATSEMLTPAGTMTSGGDGVVTAT